MSFSGTSNANKSQSILLNLSLSSSLLLPSTITWLSSIVNITTNALTQNWDFISDVVNRYSHVLRISKQCKHRLMFLNEYWQDLVGRFDHSRRYSGKFLQTLRAMENPKLPFDRAHRVAYGTELEQLQQVPERILAGFSRQVEPFPYQNCSILGIFHEWFGLWKIQGYRSIELIELHLEPGWNTWNMFLNESWQDLLEYEANFTYVLYLPFLFHLMVHPVLHDFVKVVIV